MHKYVKELLGGSLVYGLSGMISSAIMLFLVPIYTRIFTPADYGVINIVNTTYFLLGIFIIFGLDNSASLWYFEKSEDYERKKTFASWAYFSLFFSFAIFIIFLLFSRQISILLFKTDQNFYLLDLMATSLLFVCLQKVVNIWFRVRKKPVWAATYALLISLATIGLSILFVVGLKYGLRGVFYAQIGSSLLTFIVAVVLMRDWLQPAYFDRKRLGQMVKFAAPLVPAAISMWLMNSAGSYFINHYVSSSEVGLYQLGISLAGVMTLASGAFMQAWAPFGFSIRNEDDHRQTYAYVFQIYVYWGCLGVLGLFLFAPEVLMLLAPPSFGDAAFVTGLLGLNVFILSLPQIVTIGCALVKTNMPYSTAVIIGSVISVGLFIGIIPIAGKEGAVLATILGNIFIFCYVYYKAQKLYFIPYNLTKAIVSLALIAALVILSMLITRGRSESFSLFVKIGLFVAFLAFIILQSYKIARRYSSILAVTLRESENS